MPQAGGPPSPSLPAEAEVVVTVGGPHGAPGFPSARGAAELEALPCFLRCPHVAHPQGTGGLCQGCPRSPLAPSSSCPLPPEPSGSGAKMCTRGSWCQQTAEMRRTLPTPPTQNFYNQILLIFQSWVLPCFYLPLCP